MTEVVIAGAGLSGSLAAIYLSRQGHTVRVDDTAAELADPVPDHGGGTIAGCGLSGW